jgi:hypothetical protein
VLIGCLPIACGNPLLMISTSKMVNAWFND